MKCSKLLFPFAFIVILFSIEYLQGQENNFQKYSATDSSSIAELTVEEMQFYQSDYLPLSLAEKGRQSATSWRGMAPGFLDYEFEHVPLIQPLWGFWDNQLLPTELIRSRELNSATLKYQLIPAKVKASVKPVTRIAYSQDFQFGLSYLDASLIRFYRSRSYVRLSGNNFLRSGSAADYTKFQVNTYRVQVHHEFTPKFKVDFWYWQLHHNYRPSPFPVIDVIRKVKNVGQIIWLNLDIKPDSTNQYLLTPYAYIWDDHYRTITYSEQRKNQVYTGGFRFRYTRHFGAGNLFIESDLKKHQITKSLLLNNESQWNEIFRIGLKYNWKGSKFLMGGGYHHMKWVGTAPEVNFSWNLKLPLNMESHLSAVVKPQNLPLATLFWSEDSILSIHNGKMPMRKSISWKFRSHLIKNFHFKIEPFYLQFKNAWGFSRQGNKFIQRDYSNSGITGSLYGKIFFLGISDEITFSIDDKKSMMPQTNNLLKIDIPLSLFKSALKLKGYAIYHFIGNYRKIQFDPFRNQYMASSSGMVNYHILDFKLLGNVKAATLFFVWENMLSEDIALVENYFEIYRQFRFGLYWTLFD